MNLKPTQPWRPANDGTGKRKWFVCRSKAYGSLETDYHEGPTGKLIRFATMEQAQRRAEKLNAADPAPAMVWVKSTSHRSRERIETACRIAGYAEPLSWFRESKTRAFRAEHEYFTVPADVDLKRIKGITVLRDAIPAAELIRPWRSR